MAAAGVVKDFAVGHVACMLWKRVSRQRTRDCNHPENTKAQCREQRQTCKVAFGEQSWNGLFLWLTECFVAAFAASTELREGRLEACLIGYGFQLFMPGIGFCADGLKTLGISPDFGFCPGFNRLRLL